ncbi:AMP-binding protein [Balneolales bacterium ANBcel1]|nr:AMP-binding protein [Balneolales bacterium ANBcel1]
MPANKKRTPLKGHREELKEKTLPELLQRSVTRFGDRPAVGYAGREATTYSELEAKISKVASFLKENGIEEGDRVAILSENSPNWVAAYFGITSIKAIAVPVLNDFHPTEIHHILRHSDSSALFVSERLYHKVEEFDLGGLNAVILMDNLSVISPEWSKDRLRRLYAEGSRELKRIKHMALQKVGLASQDVPEDAPASIIYTSGTTGHSKGVVLTHGNIVKNAIGLDKIVDVGYTDRLLSILPLAHVYECTVGLAMPMMIGASVYYVEKPPTPPVLLPALQQVRPTVMLSVPLIIEKMYKNRILPEIRKKRLVRATYKVAAFRKLIHRKAGRKLMDVFGGELRMFPIGGASIAPEVERFMREAGFPYAVGYGLTETAPILTGSNETETRLYSVGKPLEGVEVRIDPNIRNEEMGGEPAIRETGSFMGEVGEIQVRGTGVMKEYYKDPERTAGSFTDDGWFRTGDLGSFDKDGFLYIRGRLKNMILGASGENIYPEAIESVLMRSDYVLESLVFMQNRKLVARVHLNYEKLDEDLSARGMTETEIGQFIKKLLVSIRDEANANLASFSKISEIIEQTEPFEKTPTHKIKRYLYVSDG